MTYDDLAELRATLAELAACQRELVGIAVEIDQAHVRLQATWTGRSAGANRRSASWVQISPFANQ